VGAGPDNVAHNDVTRFIATYGRLPTIPRDQDALHFTAYGGTRALRPPLTYIVSAALSKIYPFTTLAPEIAYRKGSALLASLTLGIVFCMLLVYFESYTLALLGAVLLGLLPQYVFIASYNNDDSGAIFSASLMLLSLVLLLRRGVTLRNFILFGVATGLVILSKITAWLLVPIVALFLLLFIRGSTKKLLGLGIAALTVAVLSGGWWIIFNVYHYGSDDPFQQKITKEVAKRHTKFPADRVFGYKAEGIGYRDLVLENYDGFIEKTYKSTIGNLDWLRLRFGDLQYQFYLAIFVLSVVYLALRLIRFVYISIFQGFVWDMESKKVIFEVLLFLSLPFQFFMFVWANINNDIQVQGKYLLPVAPAMLLLALAGLKSFGGVVAALMVRFGVSDISIAPGFAKGAGVFVILLFAVCLHVYSWLHYVIPFYDRPEYKLRIRPFKVVKLTPSSVLEINDVSGFDVADGVLTLRTVEGDPWVIFNKGFCKYLNDDTLVRIKMESDTDAVVKIYWDEGRGFTEDNQATAGYRKGHSEVYFSVHASGCKMLRLDPRRSSGTTRIFEIAFARFAVERVDDWRKR